MQIYPAIDIRGGRCVRLRQGDYAQETVFGDDPVAIARTYQEHGAAAISVLTDVEYFQGSLAYLTAVREAVACPVLRKDFVLDRHQLLEARAAGADAVLLIAECLPGERLATLQRQAVELGLVRRVHGSNANTPIRAAPARCS